MRMDFRSILFDRADPPEETTPQPQCFPDLNLDQVVQAICAPYESYRLEPFYYTPLHDASLIAYRQAVFQDLEDEARKNIVHAFTQKMAQVRRYLTMAETFIYPYHKKGWYLEAVLTYCQAAVDLANQLPSTAPASPGLRALSEYLAQYVSSPPFQSLWSEVQQVKQALSSLRYNIIIQGTTFRVRRYEGESDYSVEVERTFEKFRQGAVKDYRSSLYQPGGMNHVEAKILEFVTRLYPEPFAALDRFCERYATFLDDTLARFDREVQFYFAYLDFIANLRYRGLPFCYPHITCEKDLYARETFDIALARSLYVENRAIICNDFYLEEPERIFVVTGPNQGGKTTFARTFGQLHYLASLGCPVPGSAARLFLPDEIYTHFEREEDILTQSGKLQDDLLRIRAILESATSQSVIILNEIFVSTTVTDALFLSREIMRRIHERDALCVWVTFLDELATFSEKTVSMVSTVSPQNPAERTFRIVRRPADGLAYALSLAEKHRLTYPQLKERLQT